MPVMAAMASPKPGRIKRKAVRQVMMRFFISSF